LEATVRPKTLFSYSVRGRGWGQRRWKSSEKKKKKVLDFLKIEKFQKLQVFSLVHKGVIISALGPGTFVFDTALERPDFC
jgi:hypothetical protein